MQDLFSRRIVGWAMAGHVRKERVIDALEMAVAQRRPVKGLVHHSDHGQYTAVKIIEAPTRKDATQALEVFREDYGAKYPKALAKLDRDWKPLTAFYDYPAEHWRHLRTTNPIEGSFATVRLRTRVTKGAGSKAAALAMAYRLLESAQERWRRFNGHELVSDVLAGVKFKDGIKVTDDDTNDDNEMTPERVAA